MLKGKLIYIFLLFSFPSFGQSKMLLASIQQASGGGSTIPVAESFTQAFITSNSTNITVDKPTGVLNGELLVIITGTQVATNSPQFNQDTAPAGFTFYENTGSSTAGAHQGVFWRIADGTEASTFTVQTGINSNNTRRWIACIRISGNDPVVPIGRIASFNGENNTPVLSSMNTTADNSLVLYGLTTYGADRAPFSVSGTGWSETDEVDDTTGDATGTDGVWGQKDMATAGATGDVTITTTAGLDSGYAGMQIEILSNHSLSSEFIVDGDMSSDVNWSLLNGSTISGGIANVIANGSVGSDPGNWSLQQVDVRSTVDYPNKVYLLQFDARRVSGTGNLQVSERYGVMAEFMPSGTLTTYSFIYTSSTSGADNDIVFGGRTASDVFEIDNVSLKEILP